MVAGPQFRAQDFIQIGQKYLPVRGRFDRHGSDQPARAHGAPKMVSIFQWL
jgi:hypothetical protein